MNIALAFVNFVDPPSARSDADGSAAAKLSETGEFLAEETEGDTETEGARFASDLSLEPRTWTVPFNNIDVIRVFLEAMVFGSFCFYLLQQFPSS